MVDWHVGQKIVCVDNGFLDFSDAPELVEGSIYTIVSILPPKRGFFGLQVREVAAKLRFSAFDERRFQPIQTTADEVKRRWLS